MAGQKGRSGGRNRKSARELLASGTYRPSRHDGLLGEGPITAVPPAHFDNETKAVWRDLATQYAASTDLQLFELLCVHVRNHRFYDAQRGTPTANTMRGARQEAALVRAIVATLKPAGPGDAAAVDPLHDKYFARRTPASASRH